MFDDVVDLDSDIYKQSYNEGFEIGAQQVKEESLRLGLTYGKQKGQEQGFIKGCCLAVQYLSNSGVIAITEKQQATAQNIMEALEKADLALQQQNIEEASQQHQLASDKFKVLQVQLGRAILPQAEKTKVPAAQDF